MREPSRGTERIGFGDGYAPEPGLDDVFLLVGRHWPQGLLQHRTPQRRPQLVEFLFQGVKIRLLADAAQRVVLGGGQRQAGFFCNDQQEKASA